MKHIPRALLLALPLSFLTVSCEPDSAEDVGESIDNAADKVEDAVEDTADAVEDAVDEVKD